MILAKDEEGSLSNSVLEKCCMGCSSVPELRRTPPGD